MLSAILGIGSALIGGASAKSAAKAQTAAAQDAAAVQQNIFDQTSEYFAPYRDAGTNALRAYQYELGLGPMPGSVGGSAPVNYSIQEVPGQMEYRTDVPGYENVMRQVPGATTYRVGDQSFDSRDAAQSWIDSQPQQTAGVPYQGFTKTPGYDFRLREGTNAIEGSAAARGGLMSGATLQALQNYGQDYATNAYENWLSRVGGLTQMGSAAAGQQAAAGQNFANQTGTYLTQAGDARAAGTLATGNALAQGFGAIMPAIYNYQSAPTLPQGTAPMTSPRPMPRP